MARARVYADPDPEQLDPEPGASGGAATEQRSDWLTERDQARVAREMTQLWTDQSELAETQAREERWRVNELRREGWSGVRLVREGEGRYRAWIPMGGMANMELANEARRLCRVFVGNLLADPPASQVFPADASADDRDTADVSERALEDLQSPRRLNTATKLRDALDTACTYGSGHIVYTVDPTGGGRKVRTMMASPLAQTTDAPLLDPATGMPYAPQVPITGPDGQPMLDPLGQPMTQPGEPPEPVERLVAQDGKTFTDDPKQAAYDWVPDLKSEVLSGRHVRLLPHTAESVWEAHGVLVATFQPWKTLKGMFPELAKLDPKVVEELIGYRPRGSEKLLPKNRRGRQKMDDSALVFTLAVCYRECGDYPDGFYGIAVGGKLVPWRQKWVSFATGEREALLLPVAQVKLFRNGKADPAGDGLMDDLGAMSEVDAAQIGHLLQYLDWFNNPTIYVPLNSNIQDQDILARKPIIKIVPGGEPKYLQPPRYPPESLTLMEMIRDGMSKAAHLMEAAQGVEDPNVKSGRHAYQIVAQAHAQLSEPKQNIERAFIRCSEIELQYARAFGLTGDAKWTGEDGLYKMRRWQGADLAGDVKLKPGTMTMLSPAAKAQLVEQWMAAGLLAPDEGREMLAQGIGAVVGLRDDPFKLEVRRQIARWEEGPPEDWQPVDPMEHVQQLSMQLQLAPEQVQAGMQQGLLPPPPPDPMMEQLWEPRAHHALPGVAQVRLTELAKLMATRRYHAKPREWQALVEQEFGRMQMTMMPPAPPPGTPPPGEGGEPKQEPEQYGASQSGMPPIDNPALTGGTPGEVSPAAATAGV